MACKTIHEQDVFEVRTYSKFMDGKTLIMTQNLIDSCKLT